MVIRPRLKSHFQFLFLTLMGTVAALLIQYGYSLKFGTDWTTLLHIDSGTDIGKLIINDLQLPARPPKIGHDSMIYYVMARDPSCQELCKQVTSEQFTASWGFRYRRILYPLVSGLGGTLGPQSTLFALILIAALSVGVLFATHVRLFERASISPLCAPLLFAIPGVTASLVILTPDCLAAALGFSAILAMRSRSLTLSIALFALSVLTKETYLLLPLGIGTALFFNHHRMRAAILVGIPIIALAAWSAVVQYVLALPMATSTWGNVGLPFQGMLDLLRAGSGNLLLDGNYLVAVSSAVVVGIASLIIIKPQHRMQRSLILPWILMAVFLSDWIWRPGTDAARGLLPLWILTLWSLIEAMSGKRLFDGAELEPTPG